MKSVVNFILLFILILKCQCEDIPVGISLAQSNNSPQPSRYALSPTYLTSLANKEFKIYEEMAGYAEILEKRLELIRAYMKDYESSSMRLIANSSENGTPLEKAEAIASHPIVAYRMVRRFVREFIAIGKHISLGLEETLQRNINQLSAVTFWPSENELYDAMDAILRVNYVYDLDISEFSRGNIMGIQTNVGLTTSQSYEFAEYATIQKHYSLALSWLNETESRMKEVDKDESRIVMKDDIEEIYRELVTNHDSDYDKNTSQLFMFTEKLSKNPNAPTFRKNGPLKADGFNFLDLCNGADLQTPKYKAALKCWYDRRHPYFYLFPLKAELLNQNPLLIQFHEIVGSTWIKEMKEKALPTLERAPPGVPGATVRTAVYGWLADEDIPNVPLSKRIELITGLKVKGKKASTDLQIAGYAYGGHVALHVDAFRQMDSTHRYFELGNRVTSFLIYLNEVERGGFTVFPDLKTYVEPTMGSAVLWYNSLRNGEVDERMTHFACPVVLGHKWIATKWTHLNQNFLKWPCDLNPQL